MNDVVIRAENLSKRYRIGSGQGHYTYGSLRDSLSNAALAPVHRLRRRIQGTKPPEPEHIWALKDVSFEVRRGEALGIIGRNGAGKSTLLKILSRITKPTKGRVTLRGRVGSLLEVGTGFHPELTGRENIYLNGAILGMKRVEIERKFDEIVDFAEIEKFLDTAVKYYSSGMYMRLAFAVAAHLEPEILLIDEVLAVGDAAFQKKCLGKMGEVAKSGRTVLFVSHNMGAIVKLCPSSLWLTSGQLTAVDSSTRIVEKYLATSYENTAIRRFEPRQDRKASILHVRLLNGNGEETSEFPSGRELIVEVGFVLNENVSGCHVACIVSTLEGFHLFSTADTDTNLNLFERRKPGKYVARVKLPIHFLNTGTYNISVGIGIPGSEVLDRQDALSFSIHDAGDFGSLKERERRAGLLLVQAPWQYYDWQE
jgi:lipopolysaccharide transport system ATP-binding protein